MTRGGARKNSGVKPGPHGKKRCRSVALSADVWAFLALGEQSTNNRIESILRDCPAFVAWLEAQKPSRSDIC